MEINRTVSWVEVIWIVMALLPIGIRCIPLTYRWYNDFFFARKHKQEARELAALLLMSVGIGCTGLLFFNGFAGIISGMLPPNGGRVSPLSASIAIMLILGQVCVIIMLEAVNYFYNRILALGEERVQGLKQDHGR